MSEISINGRIISQKSQPYFIADIAANHDGDLNRALMLIELAKESGADAAKFQNFKASKIVSRRGFDAMGSQLSHQSNWQKSVFEIYEDASISYDWTSQLKAKCDEVGIEYFTSPYDVDSVDAVDPYVALYKIGSGDITWLDIIKYIAQKNKPVLIASGASSMEDVDRAMEVILKQTDKIVLMQCNTNYTGSSENFKYINLNVLKSFKAKYPQLILGLSDHTHGHSSVLGAQALGATVFEKHFTDDNRRTGPDHKFAMNPYTWREMIIASNELFQALGDGIKKIEENEKQTVLVQRRGLRYKRDLRTGHTITEADIFPLRPYKPDGFHPYQKDTVIGKTLCKDIDADQLVRPGDISDD
jgi:sialic acid synthase SpsE